MKKRLFALLLALALLLAGCGAPAQVSGEGLEVHFLDVGQADCALLICGDEAMLIDGGNRDDSQLVVSYLQQQGVQELKAVVCSHAHEDHVGGLPGVLAVYPTQAVYAPTKTYASKVFDDFLYYTDQQGLEVTIPAPGDTLRLGQAQITVLGPVASYPETNDTSLILRVDYGENALLFTGDQEQTAEHDLLEYWQSQPGTLDVDVLKVGHHGSDTSTGYRFLYEVSPEYGILSVGRDNSYGHPHAEPLSRLEQAGVMLLRTDQLGTIVARCDGQQIQFTWDNPAAQPDAPEAVEEGCIGNRNTQKFHSPDCANLPAPKNQIHFSSYDEAIAAGFQPCGSCLGS